MIEFGWDLRVISLLLRHLAPWYKASYNSKRFARPVEAVLEDTQFDLITEPESLLDGGSVANESSREPGGVSAFRWILELMQTLLMAVILYFLIDTVVARVRVENISMLPTLREGEFLLVNKMAYRFGEVENGDIVVFHNPLNPQEDYIKRVIGVPGDKVEVHDYQVFSERIPG